MRQYHQTMKNVTVDMVSAAYADKGAKITMRPSRTGVFLLDGHTPRSPNARLLSRDPEGAALAAASLAGTLAIHCKLSLRYRVPHEK